MRAARPPLRIPGGRAAVQGPNSFWAARRSPGQGPPVLACASTRVNVSRRRQPGRMTGMSGSATELKINLPDGSEKALPEGATGLDLARSIAEGLARSAVAVQVD